MGTVINEVGSTAAGVAKVEYKDEAGNVLWYYDDAGNFVRNGNIKIDGNLIGTNNIAIQGTAYSNLENNVKIVQGVPAGGKMYLGAGAQTGAVKIKLPKAKSNAMFKFHVRINGYPIGSRQSNAEYFVNGYNFVNGFGYNADTIASCQVTAIRDNPSLMLPVFYFCNGSTEDYILIGEITDTHNFKSVVVDNVETHYTGSADDWSKDWAISLVTTLETLTSTYKVAVIPSLNATHLNGVQETTTGEANKIMKLSTNGEAKAQFFQVTSLNTAPASPTATGTTGEIRIANSGIYYCVATNKWGKTLPVSVVSETVTGLTSTFKNSTLAQIFSTNKYQWTIVSGASGGVIESTHNTFSGNNTSSLVTGATVQVITPNSVYSMRIGDSVLEIKFDIGTGVVSYRIASGTVTEITVTRLQHIIGW